MYFRNKLHDPNVTLRLGLVFLIVAMLAARFLHPMPHLSEDSADAIKGLLYGLAIGFMLLSVYLRGRNRPRPTALS